MSYFLFSFIQEQALRETAESLYVCSDIPVHLLDGIGKVIFSYGKMPESCLKAENCQDNHSAAAAKAVDFGESYIFSCPCGLTHIIYPFFIKGTLLGSILVGPLYISGDEEEPPVSDAKRITPTKFHHLGKLVTRLFSNLLSGSEKEYRENQQKLHQQSKINESIQMYKRSGENAKTPYPFDKEKELILKVKTGDSTAAKATLNDLLGYVFFSEGNSLSTLKARAIELTSLLSRAAIEGGAATDEVLKINNSFLNTIQEINSLESLCFRLQESVDVFAECMFSRLPTKNYALIRSAIEYICANFNADISLEDVAETVHLNATYFSTLFKQSTGSSFKEYLNMIRVEESKRLLANTNYSIIDIAIATGFEDQSYFSKVFKKYTGITPKQYRQ